MAATLAIGTPFARLELPLARLHGALHTSRVLLVVLIGLRAYYLLARSGRLGSGARAEHRR